MDGWVPRTRLRADRNFLSPASKVERPWSLESVCPPPESARLTRLKGPISLNIGIGSPAIRPSAFRMAHAAQTSPDRASAPRSIRAELPDPGSARGPSCPLLFPALEMPQDRVDHVVLRDERDDLHHGSRGGGSDPQASEAYGG